ncbi:hypothetical protein OSB04_018412 [Centaurea solstitialis]|uniref:Uncharacterized protein n=1 Tax=Centaurea solstitialis TaxID=347529 RepID=A0AA38TMV6_9ASTR|nr:hypothetical protein OSB04_018412 [Centaurea solstitialis]
MAGKTTYVTKGYSTYTNIPVPKHVYDHGPKNPDNRRAPTGFTDFVGSPSKAELLKEYVHSPSMTKTPKYASPAPGYEPEYGLDYENSSPPKYHGQDGFQKPVHGYHSEEARLTHSRSGLEGTRHVRTGNISSSNKSWQIAGPPATHHPLTGPTNDINEALGVLEESIYYSPRADPRRRGVLDDLSTRAHPVEPLRRYARPAFVANSHEGMRRYRLEPFDYDAYHNDRAHLYPSYENVNRPEHATKDHREGNEPDYRSDNENSSALHHHGRESELMKISELSSPNKHQPTSPIHNHPSEEEARPITTRNLFGPNKY